ncbi:MAG TPA: hypothetical protein VGD56_06700 [Gemmatirosa sp.]
MSIEPRTRSLGEPETGASAASAPSADAPDAYADEWAHLWFTLERHGWGSLALVPAEPGASAWPLAERLAEAARAYHASPVEVFDAERAGPEDVQAVTGAVGARAAEGARVLLVLASPLVRAPAVPLARAADAALLVVPLGTSAAGEARRTVAAVGQPHFVGSVTVRDR